MKKLVILVVLMLLIAGGGGAALYFLKLGPFAVPPGEAAEAEEPDPDPPKFVELAPMSVPIIQGDRVVTTIQVQLVLETLDPEVEYAIKREQTRIKDAFLRDLHGFMPRLLRKSDTIDVVVLKKRLKMIADRTLGKGKITNVLIQSITEQ